VAEPIETRLWPKEVGADYFTARTGRAAERVDAEALSEALGGLPLAHEQAAAYCERLDVTVAGTATAGPRPRTNAASSGSGGFARWGSAS
jgi:hypothetical protein